MSEEPDNRKPSGAGEFAAQYDPDLETDNSSEHLAATRTGKHPAPRAAQEQAREEERIGADALQRRDMQSPGTHEQDGEPREIQSGWIVKCSCGWTNEQKPAGSADEAREQLATHQRRFA